MALNSKQKLLTVAVFVAAAGLFWLFGGSESRPKAGVDAEDKELVALGQTAYADHCASCHGARLEGQPGWRSRNADGTLKPPPHDESGHTWHHSDKVLFDYTKLGGAGMAPPGFKSAMPGFGGNLEDDEIWAVLAFIKSRWPREVLARQRQITARGR